MTAPERVRVRGFGFDVIHFADVAADELIPDAWPGREHPFTGVATGTAAICGVVPKSAEDVLVVMRKADANCPLCLRIAARDGAA